VSSGLEAYTSDELVQELTERATWVGLVIASVDEARPPMTTHHRRFELRFNTETLEVPDVRLLLEGVLTQLPLIEDASP